MFIGIYSIHLVEYKQALEYWTTKKHLVLEVAKKPPRPL